MKALLTTLLLLPATLFAQTEIRLSGGVAPFSLPQYWGSSPKMTPAVFGISVHHNITQRIQVGLSVSKTDFKTYGLLGVTTADAYRLNYYFVKNAIPVTLEANYTRWGFYAGVNAGVLIAAGPGGNDNFKNGIPQGGGKPGEEYDTYLDRKSGAVLGAQIGYSHLIGKHFTLGAQVKADRYFGKYAIWYFPTTIQAGWRL